MSDLPGELPSDPAELRVFAAALLDRCAKLERLLKLAKDAQFGRSSEKLDADQLQLVLEDIEEAIAALEAAEDRANPRTCEKRTAERRANRGQLPEHLPRTVEILMPAATFCPCRKGDLVEIGRDETQRLDVVPAQYRVIVTRRPKLACRACHGVVLLPLYRQSQMLAMHGIAIDRSTLAFRVGYAAQELKPLWHRLRELLLASSKLCVVETPAPVLDPGRGRTKTGYFWALSRDDRPWAGPDPPGVVYAYAPGQAVHGLRLLEGYRGIIHCDGYQAYKTMTRETRAGALSGTLAFCWSHLRRQFMKIEREAAPAATPVAREALERIAQLYAVEKALRGRSAAERSAGRQAHVRPLAAALKQWFEAKLDHLAQKSDTAKALRYALRHWDGLTLYLDDGRIEMDTNAVERAMRPIKLNARNSRFAGCDEGAESWAVLASLIETCKLNSVSAEHWLADVLAKLIDGWPAARLDELLPWASTYTMDAHDPRLAA